MSNKTDPLTGTLAAVVETGPGDEAKISVGQSSASIHKTLQLEDRQRAKWSISTGCLWPEQVSEGKKNSDQASQCRSSFDEGLHSLGKDEVDRAKQQHARAPFFSPGRGKGPDQLATLVFGTGAGSEKRKQGFAADLGGCHSRSKGQAIPAEGRWMPSVSLLSREGTRSRDWVQMPCLGQLRRCRFMSHFAI